MTTQTLRKQSARLVSLKGKKCEKCGEEKKEGKQNLTRHHYEDEPDKIEILCRKCHAEVHVADGTWGHRRKDYLNKADTYREDQNMGERIIAVTCRGTTTIPLNDLEDFQGDLKTISDTEMQKLKYSILTKGFAFPVFVWEGHNKVLDGHQRVRATLDLINDEGYVLEGPVPCVEIPAKDEKEAKEKLLLISSRYGKVHEQGFIDFVQAADIDLGELELAIDMPEIDLSSLFTKAPCEDAATDKKEETKSEKSKRELTCPECGHKFQEGAV